MPALAAAAFATSAAAGEPVAIERADAPSVIALLAPFLDDHPESMEGRASLTLAIEKAPDGSHLVVTIAKDGYLDDAQRGDRYRGEVVPGPEGWTLRAMTRTPICWRGEPTARGTCP
ncbi:MAG: hypothetical protein AAF318_00780 [Pseudomonadota bacterium]